MRSMIPVSLALLLALLLAACGDAKSTAPGGPLAVGTMNADMHARRARALTARDMLMKQLGGKLKSTIGGEGPVAAIAVCKEAAPAIAAEVSAEHGLKIGRTSFRLRNDSNQVPAWAQAAVDHRVKEPTWFTLENGDLGGLLPIMVQPLCTMCHGAPEAQGDALRAALREHYPDDMATGFAVGDLRGWFWVEVPAKP